MKKATVVLSTILALALLGTLGCSSTEERDPAAIRAPLQASDSARLQGAWTGREPAATPEGPSHFTIAGDVFEFHGTDANEWYKGTFTLKESANPKQILITVKDCPAPDYVGKTSHGIYRFEGGKLIITANEPGNEEWPSGFEASGSRTIEFTK